MLTDLVVTNEQGEFRAGGGCADQVFAVRQAFEVIEKDVEYAAFVDLERAYDRVSRDRLWEVLKDYGKMGKLLVAIQSLYEDGWARVRAGIFVIFAIESAKLHNIKYPQTE